MDWIRHADRRAPSYPAGWLIETGRRPGNLAERRALRGLIGRRVLATQLGSAAGEAVISHDPRGRPVLTSEGGEGGPLHLSLATRAGVVAIGLARSPVGVDVEAFDAVPSPLPVSVLHPDERRDLRDLAPEAATRAFARLWAAKEAYVKALGLGFVRPPESFAVRFEDGALRVDDPAATAPVAFAEAGVTRIGEARFAAAIVVLEGTGP